MRTLKFYGTYGTYGTLVLAGLTVLTLMLLASSSRAQDQPAARSEPSAPPKQPAPPQGFLALADDPVLQEKVTIGAINTPLRDLLADLSPRLAVDLIATARVADQRVSLQVTEEPLFRVMERVSFLLGHSQLPRNGYHWDRVRRASGQRPAYSFGRDLGSLAKEKEALHYPRKRMGELFREIHHLLNLSPEQREKYKGNYPPQYLSGEGVAAAFREAITGLSKARVEAVIAGEVVPLNPPARSPAIVITAQDEDGPFPENSHLFNISLRGIRTESSETVLQPGQTASTSIVIDPYRPSFLTTPLLPPEIKPGGPILDLTKAFGEKGVTDSQRGDLGFTLTTLAKVAGINLYQEAFLRRADTPLTPLKGTLRELLTQVCLRWNIQVKKAGEDYLVWNTTWAQNRAHDVPQRLIMKWQAASKKNGGLPIEDQAQVAAALSFAQIHLTLSVVLPEVENWSQLNYPALHLLGNLTAGEWRTAERGGLPLSAMQPHTRQVFLQGFGKEAAGATEEALSGVLLTIQREQVTPGSGKAFQRITVKAAMEGQTLNTSLHRVELPKSGAARDR